MKRKQHNYNLIIGATIVSILILMMLISFFYTPHNPNEMITADRLHPPSAKYLFGTDNFGRDILSRMMQATQTVFQVGISSIAIGLIGGLLVGSLAGYCGGWVDELLMRVMDAMLAIPGILFTIMLVSIFDPSLTNTILALGIPRIPSFARIVRSGFLQVKEFDFVKSSKIKGASHWHIIRHHILPNITTQIIVITSLSFSTIVLSEAGLSYLGLGVQPPDPSWGRMLSEAKPYLINAPWYIISVGISITLLVFGFNLLGDGIRKMQDKRRD